ncbi:MAG TPA: rRNA maturation RNase YbeY [Candidatus Dormibacteraeota bacterium]
MVASAELGSLLRRAGNDLGVAPRATLTLLLTDDAELRALNGRFLGVDASTDVLAFPAGDGDEARGSRAGERIGDIAISVEQAAVQGSEPSTELRLLAVHGLLHCLGHDHAESAAAARMTAVTRRLLPNEAVPDLQSAAEVAAP